MEGISFGKSEIRYVLSHPIPGLQSLYVSQRCYAVEPCLPYYDEPKRITIQDLEPDRHVNFSVPSSYPVEVKSPFESMARIEGIEEDEYAFTSVHFNHQASFATSPLHLRHYARPVKYLPQGAHKEFYDYKGNTVIADCIIVLNITLNRWPTHMIFPAYNTLDEMSIRCYCVSTNHISIPYQVLLQLVEINVHLTVGIPPGMTRFGNYDGGMDMHCFELLLDPTSTSGSTTRIPMVTRYPPNNRPVHTLWRGPYLDFEATVTTAVPRNGTLATPLMRIPGYVVVGKQYGWCPEECISFALDTRYLTHPYMVDQIVDRPTARYMVIKLRIQCLGLDPDSKWLLGSKHQNSDATTWFCPINTHKIAIACPAGEGRPPARIARLPERQLGSFPIIPEPSDLTHQFLEIPIQNSEQLLIIVTDESDLTNRSNSILHEMKGYYQRELSSVGWCHLGAVSHAIRIIRGMTPANLTLRNGQQIVSDTIIVLRTLVSKLGITSRRDHPRRDGDPQYVLFHSADIEFALMPQSRYDTMDEADSSMEEYNKINRLKVEDIRSKSLKQRDRRLGRQPSSRSSQPNHAGSNDTQSDSLENPTAGGISTTTKTNRRTIRHRRYRKLAYSSKHKAHIYHRKRMRFTRRCKLPSLLYLYMTAAIMQAEVDKLWEKKTQVVKETIQPLIHTIMFMLTITHVGTMVYNWFAKLHASKPSRIIEWSLENLFNQRGGALKRKLPQFLLLLNGCAIVWTQRELEKQHEFERTNYYKGTAFRTVMILTILRCVSRIVKGCWGRIRDGVGEIIPRITTWFANKHLLQCLMIRTQCFSVTANSSTPCTTVRINDMHFSGAADSHSGVNIISPRALKAINKRFNSILNYYKCKYRLVVANKDVVDVSREVKLSFSLPEVSDQKYSRRFLIMDTPLDIILSHDTLERTSLGYHIY